MKRKWLHELPYLLIALYATKIGQAWRLAEGTDAVHKLLSLMDKPFCVVRVAPAEL